MKPLPRRLAVRLRARLHPGERGFTLVETVIAMSLIFASLVAAAYAISAGFRYNALARERQAATGIANQLMEQVRALAWDRFTKGLADSDLTGDPENILSCVEGGTTVYRFRSCTAPPAGTLQAAGAKIVHTPNLPDECSSGPPCPLVPHRGTITSGPATYSWSAYVTNEDPKTQPYIITVFVSWTAARTGGPATFIQLQSVAYNPKGCGGEAVHPFAGPCTYFQSADASVVAGRIDFADTTTMAGSNCPGTSTCVSIVPQAADASGQSEQAASVQSSATQGGIECAAANPPCSTTKYGEVSIAASADSNAVTALPAYGSVPSLTPTSGSFSVAPGTGTTLTVANNGGGAATASTVSATAPTSVSTNPCPLTSGLAVSQQTDGLPCAASVSRPGATTTALLDMSGVVVGGASMGQAYLAQVAAPPSGNAASAFVDVKAAPDPEDAMRATTARTFGTVSLFQLPSAIPVANLPLGWSSSGNYLVTMTGYGDQASAAAGATTNAPTASASAGSISYYNGLGFASVNVTSLAAGDPIPLPANIWTTPWRLGTGASRRWVCAGIIPSLTYGGPSTNSVGTPRTSAKASMGAPIKGTVTYRLDVYSGSDPLNCATPSVLSTLASTPVNLTASIDLGTAQAVATYKPAPTDV